MSNQSETTFTSKCDILGEFWIEYKLADEFYDFCLYNDLGLPLAYLLSQEIVTQTPKSVMFINETWELFLATLETTDVGYEQLSDVMETRY